MHRDRKKSDIDAVYAPGQKKSDSDAVYAPGQKKAIVTRSMHRDRKK